LLLLHKPLVIDLLFDLARDVVDGVAEGLISVDGLLLLGIQLGSSFTTLSGASGYEVSVRVVGVVVVFSHSLLSDSVVLLFLTFIVDFRWEI
jgi:hypothetical protein